MSQTEKKERKRDPEQHSVTAPPLEIQRVLNALKVFRDVPMDLSIELGRGKVKLRDLLGLRYHSICELDKNAGSKLNVYINGVLLGKAEPVILEDRVGITIDEILEPED